MRSIIQGRTARSGPAHVPMLQSASDQHGSISAEVASPSDLERSAHAVQIHATTSIHDTFNI